MNELLSIRGIDFAYRDNIKVIDNLAIEWRANEIHGLIGANGSGKSTLFKLIKGLLKPQVGEFEWQGNQLDKNVIAFLPTELYFYPKIKGLEYLEFFKLNNKNFDFRFWNDLMGLPLNQLVDSYSTGMKKKLAIMGLIALDKEVMLLDEPFNGLDSDSFQVLQEIVVHLSDQNKTIILSSHISHSLTDICEDIAFLENGKIERLFGKSEFETMNEELFAKKREEVRTKLRVKN